MKLKKQKGFTLVELLISISLIIILIGVMIPAINAVRDHGKSTMAKAEAAALKSAIISYQARYNMFPLEKTQESNTKDLKFYGDGKGSEVLDAEKGWQLLKNIAAKNDKGVFLIELDNYKEGDDGEVLDPYGNPYLFLFDIHNGNGEFVSDGKIKITNNSFNDYRKKSTKYSIKSSSVGVTGIRVLYFTGDGMKEID